MWSRKYKNKLYGFLPIILMTIILIATLYNMAMHHVYMSANLKALDSLFVFKGPEQLVRKNAYILEDLVSDKVMEKSTIKNKSVIEDRYFQFRGSETSIKDVKFLNNTNYIVSFKIVNKHISEGRTFICVFENELGLEGNNLYFIDDIHIYGVYDINY